MAAYAQVFAEHGFAGATIASVAATANIAAGLVHHHFQNKDEMTSALLAKLLSDFRDRVRNRALQANDDEDDALGHYIDAALKLDARADLASARCWVGVFAQALRSPSLFAQMRRLIDSEISAIHRAAAGKISEQDAGALLAFIIGSLVLGAFAPRKVSGFAAPAVRKFVLSLTRP